MLIKLPFLQFIHSYASIQPKKNFPSYLTFDGEDNGVAAAMSQFVNTADHAAGL